MKTLIPVKKIAIFFQRLILPFLVLFTISIPFRVMFTALTVDKAIAYLAVTAILSAVFYGILSAITCFSEHNRYELRVELSQLIYQDKKHLLEANYVEQLPETLVREALEIDTTEHYEKVIKLLELTYLEEMDKKPKSENSPLNRIIEEKEYKLKLNKEIEERVKETLKEVA